jgi:hypothetical protein
MSIPAFGGVGTPRSFVAPKGNEVQTGLFLPESGQIVVKNVASVAAVVNVGHSACRLSRS